MLPHCTIILILNYILPNGHCFSTNNLASKLLNPTKLSDDFVFGIRPMQLSAESTNQFQLIEECSNGTEVVGVEAYLQQNALLHNPKLSSIKLSDVQFNFQLLDFQDPLSQSLQLEPATGRLFVHGRIDREFLCSEIAVRKSTVNSRPNSEFNIPYQSTSSETCVKKLRVLSTAWLPGDKQPEISTLPLEIHIEDINDNSPQWFDIHARSPYQIGLVEQKQTFVIELKLPELSKDIVSGHGTQSTRIGLPIAHDPDDGLNGRINYRIEPFNLENPTNEHIETTTKSVTLLPFVIEQQPNGALDLVATTNLDYEKQALYQFYLIATDTGTPAKTTTALVKVHLVDVNDEAPVFERSVFYPSSGAVSEKSLPGILLLNVSATDSDASTINNRLRYAMVPNALASKYFTVHTDGRVTLRHRLDYESMETSASMMYLTQNIHSFESKKQFVFQVEAIDSAPQPYEKTGTAMVIVPVIDENDEAPVITVRYLGPPDQTNQGEIGAVLENAAVPIKLAYIQVRDMDYEGKDQVTCQLSDSTNFSLTPISSMHSADLDFRIDRQDEAKNDFVLNLLTKIDREMTPLLYVRLKCLDQAGNTNEQTMRIRVMDANDENPKFSQSIYRFYLPENTDPQDKESGELQNNSSAHSFGYRIGRVSAQDADVGDNARLIYRLEPKTLEIKQLKVTGKTLRMEPLIHHTFFYRPQFDVKPRLEELFQVEPETGFIRALKSFDAENVDLIRFTVSAIDQPTNIKAVSHTGTAVVEVKISDVNDWSPMFYNASITSEQHSVGVESLSYPPVEYVANYVFRVKENRPAFWLVGRVAAVDPDVGQQWSEQTVGQTIGASHSVVILRIAQEAEPEVRKSFNLHANSGHLRTIISLDREVKAVYVFPVVAIDSAKDSTASKTTTATVTVFVEDENDNSPVFVKPISVTSDVADSHSLSDMNIPLNVKRNSQSTVNSNAKNVKMEKSEKIKERPHLSQISSSNSGSQETSVPIIVVHKHTWTQQTDPIGGSQIAHGRPLLQIEATDADEGENGMVTYHIGAGNHDGLFQLDNTTGTLVLSPDIRAPIPKFSHANDDYEADSQRISGSNERVHLTYLLRFEACDRGVPKRCALPIWVRMVLDMNDWPHLIGRNNMVAQSNLFDEHNAGINSLNSGNNRLGNGQLSGTYLTNSDVLGDSNNAKRFALLSTHQWASNNADEQPGLRKNAISEMYGLGEQALSYIGSDNYYNWAANRHQFLQGTNPRKTSQSATSNLVVSESIIICLVVIFIILLCAASVLVYLVRRKVILFRTTGKSKMKFATRDVSTSNGLTAEKYINEPMEMAENASVYRMVHSGVTVIADSVKRSQNSTPDSPHSAVNEKVALDSFPAQPLLRRNSDSRLGPGNKTPYMSSMTESIYVTNGLFKPARQTTAEYQSFLHKNLAATSKVTGQSMTPFCETSSNGQNSPNAYIDCMVSPRGHAFTYQSSTPIYRLHSSPLSAIRNNYPINQDMTALTSSLYGSRSVKQSNQTTDNSMSVYSPDTTNPSKWPLNKPHVDNTHTYHELNSLTATLRRHNYVPPGKCAGILFRPSHYTSFQPNQNMLTSNLRPHWRVINPGSRSDVEVIHEAIDDTAESHPRNTNDKQTSYRNQFDNCSERFHRLQDQSLKSNFVAHLDNNLPQECDRDGNKGKSSLRKTSVEVFNRNGETMKTSASSLPLILDTNEEFTCPLNLDSELTTFPCLPHLSIPNSPGLGKYVYDAYREASFV